MNAYQLAGLREYIIVCDELGNELKTKTPQEVTAMSMDGYSDRFVQMASTAGRYGVLEKPDGYGKRTGDCGDTVEFYLSVRGGQMRMVTFQISGCLNTYACANTVSYLVEGRTIGDCWEITPANVIEFLESLPGDHHHCAELVVGAFYHALNDYNKKLREPWRKDYPEKLPG